MKIKIVLIVLVLGLTLTGCKQSSISTVADNDTENDQIVIEKTEKREYTELQQMFIDLNAEFKEEDVLKYIDENNLVGGRHNYSHAFEYEICSTEEDYTKQSPNEYILISFTDKDEIENYCYYSSQYSGDVFYYVSGTYWKFSEKNAKDYRGYYFNDIMGIGEKKGIEIEYTNGNKTGTDYIPATGAVEALDLLFNTDQN